MVPGRWVPASRMAAPRSATSRTPSSKARAPEATSAVYSPRLWPATTEGSTPTRSTASSTTRLATKVASWACSVALSSSASASSSSWATSRPTAVLASSTSSHEGWSVHALPMPGFCEPWPGKVNEIIEAGVPRLVVGRLTRGRGPTFQWHGSRGARRRGRPVPLAERDLVAGEEPGPDQGHRSGDGRHHRQTPAPPGPAAPGTGCTSGVGEPCPHRSPVVSAASRWRGGPEISTRGRDRPAAGGPAGGPARGPGRRGSGCGGWDSNPQAPEGSGV